jgi:hypothetical protein
VCININGERTQYFNTYGLRQGDPLSPILFNIVAEVLATLMRRAAEQGKVRGVMSHLVPEGIAHIQYVDDTILMIEGDDNSVINIKFILYCFEWLSGLKINYHKSGAYIFEMEKKDKVRIANMLNCKLGELPMVYLGISLNGSKLGRGAFTGLTEKISKRIPPWKGKNMSSSARLILFNSFLASLPTYTIDFYLLPLGTHRNMNTVKSKFFWRGARDEFKYHMVKWEAMCRPKETEGLMILNTQIFNDCILVKWIWKLYHQKDRLWARLLSAKYLRGEETSLNPAAHMAHSSEKVYIRSIICFNGESYTRWDMANQHSYGMMSGSFPLL